MASGANGVATVVDDSCGSGGGVAASDASISGNMDEDFCNPSTSFEAMLEMVPFFFPVFRMCIQDNWLLR